MRAVLSDLDGVLVDSTPAVVRAWSWWAADRGIELARLEAVMHGRPTAEVIELVAPDLDATAEARRVEEREVSDTDGLQALPGARELFQLVPAERLAVVTSGTHALATARLHAVGLRPPPVLVTADRVRRGKPDPEAYLLAARELGVAPDECVVFEDSPAGVEAGRAAGMHVVGVLTTHEQAALTNADDLTPDLAQWLIDHHLDPTAPAQLPHR